MSNNYFKKYLIGCALLLMSLFYISAIAQETKPEAVVTDFLNVYNFSANKVAQLAEAIPADKYDWRPAEGIRSIREVILHSTAGNYFFGSILGATPPEGVDPQSLEKSEMRKEKVTAAFKKSLTIIQEALKKLTKEQLNEQIEFFGNKISKRQAMFGLGDHVAEHLGQLIAYARMNGVVPPWSKKTN